MLCTLGNWFGGFGVFGVDLREANLRNDLKCRHRAYASRISCDFVVRVEPWGGVPILVA